jgi:hypothetical protein
VKQRHSTHNHIGVRSFGKFEKKTTKKQTTLLMLPAVIWFYSNFMYFVFALDNKSSSSGFTLRMNAFFIIMLMIRHDYQDVFIDYSMAEFVWIE